MKLLFYDIKSGSLVFLLLDWSEAEEDLNEFMAQSEKDLNS